MSSIVTIVHGTATRQRPSTIVIAASCRPFSKLCSRCVQFTGPTVHWVDWTQFYVWQSYVGLSFTLNKDLEVQVTPLRFNMNCHIFPHMEVLIFTIVSMHFLRYYAVNWGEMIWDEIWDVPAIYSLNLNVTNSFGLSLTSLKPGSTYTCSFLPYVEVINNGLL